MIVADRLQRRAGIKQLRRDKMSEIMRPVDIIRIPDLIFLAEPLHLASKCACLVCAAPSVFEDILIGSDGIPADVFPHQEVERLWYGYLLFGNHLVLGDGKVCILPVKAVSIP